MEAILIILAVFIFVAVGFGSFGIFGDMLIAKIEKELKIERK